MSKNLDILLLLFYHLKKDLSLLYKPRLSVYDSSGLLVFIIKSGICKLVPYHQFIQNIIQ